MVILSAEIANPKPLRDVSGALFGRGEATSLRYKIGDFSRLKFSDYG
jgi:hypothetical protein